RGLPMAGVPFNDKRGVFPTDHGRVTEGDTAVPGLYAAGWIKRGPTGIIGTNRADAVSTVKSLLEDLDGLDSGAVKPSSDGLLATLAEKGVRVVSYDDWKKIDAAEVARGASYGKPREKFVDLEGMLEAVET
ncbi:MAG: NADP oxidoreductase, partial [Gammaproteobacteria bacterium]